MDEQTSQLLSTLSGTAGTSSMFVMIGGFVFGIIGFFAFIRGWKTKSWRPLAIGFALSIFPWFISNTFFFFLTGLGLCFLLYYFRE